MTLKSLRKYLGALLMSSLLLLSIGLTGCDNNDGPMEETGDKLDEAYEKAKDTMDDAGDKMKDIIEDAGDKIEDATD